LAGTRLFGRDRGACVGTPENTGSLLAAAEGGTLFLDEIGNLNGAMQMSMLRVLERREYHQVGGTRALHANARVISASHRDLQELVLAGRFRDDLLYRISTVDLRVPPLRERPEDIRTSRNIFCGRSDPWIGQRDCFHRQRSTL
jgi:transcriptional regulator with GAF, ATPase, and Fis domain